jgi:hypothetical protein
MKEISYAQDYTRMIARYLLRCLTITLDLTYEGVRK